MMLAHTAAGLSEATPDGHGTCPACAAGVIPKCGSLVVWHWAHRVNDCDSWTEPETAWHRGWKRHGDHVEVVMRRDGQCHRADLVTPTGLIVELQSRYLDVDAITAREQFYGRMWWLYRATWTDRLHFGKYGFWWKHGAKTMTTHRRPVYWDVETQDEVWQVSLGMNASGSRVLGKVHEMVSRDTFATSLGAAAWQPTPLQARDIAWTAR